MSALPRSAPLRQRSEALGWLPLVALPATVLVLLHSAQPWVFMWALAIAIFAGFKWLTWWRAAGTPPSPSGGGPGWGWRSLAYLVAWPGMDATGFLYSRDRLARTSPTEWLAAGLKTLLGAVLFWGLARHLVTSALLAGWVGLFGLIFLLHFGSFHLVSLTWRSAGIQAPPIMDMPIRASSLSDLWGRRWNLAFHELARDLVVRVVRHRIGPVGATLLVFALSGLIHDLVISVPAGGGYGLPTVYFLLQGVGVLLERSPLGARLALRRGVVGRLYALAIAGLPAFWLFHPPFVLRVIVPFMRAMGAL